MAAQNLDIGISHASLSPRQAEFWFNPVEVWGLNGTNAESLFPKELKDGLNTYKHVSKYMFIVYVIALVATKLSPGATPSAMKQPPSAQS